MKDKIRGQPITAATIAENSPARTAILRGERVFIYLPNLYPTPLIVFMYLSPIFSLNFLICTSIVRSPTTTSSPQTEVKIYVAGKNLARSRDVSKRQHSSNSFFGSVNFDIVSVNFNNISFSVNKNALYIFLSYWIRR